MNIAFRVDASTEIGTGHFMRCLALAQKLRNRGESCKFICRHLPHELRQMLLACQHRFTILEDIGPEASDEDIHHSSWLGVSQSTDARQTLAALSDHVWDWLVVDHYAIDLRWEAQMRMQVRKIFVIDDLADRAHDCDVLLDQNFYSDMADRYVGKVPQHCICLLGPRFAMIRDEFSLTRSLVRAQGKEISRVLVFFGGIDRDNFTSFALNAIREAGPSTLTVDVVIGAAHPFRSTIEQMCIERGHRCHVQATNMAELMSKADLAVGAGGVALWERCCLGLPTIALATADNQKRQLEDAAAEGLVYAPNFSKKDNSGLILHLRALFQNRELRTHLSRTAMKSVDGLGLQRVVRVLSESKISLRVVREEDSPNLFQWRNDVHIRSFSRNPELIAWQDHQRWFSNTLASTSRDLLVGYRRDEPVGVVRFDRQSVVAEISIYLVPEIREAGLGFDLLRSAESWLKNAYPEIKKIEANVLAANQRSAALFAGSSYELESTTYIKRLTNDSTN